MTAALPRGTVTFLMSDVEGSTALWHREGPCMDQALDHLDTDIRRAVEANGGAVIKSRGEGDSHFAVFDRASAAVLAAVEIQRCRADILWPTVRIAINTGEAEPRDGDYLGAMVNRTARVRGSAHGRQVVCTRVVADLSEGLDEVRLTSLGSHRFLGSPAPVDLFQVRAPGLVENFPPLVTLDTTAAPIMAVAFVDQIGSQAHVAAPHERLATWQGNLFRAVRVAAEAHGGRFLKLMGDGGMASFEDPRAAVAFARELCDRPLLHMRGSVTAGIVEVIEGELSGAALFEGSAHLKGLDAGEVWISPVVDALIGGGVTPAGWKLDPLQGRDEQIQLLYFLGHRA